MFLRNVGIHIQVDTASQPRTWTAVFESRVLRRFEPKGEAVIGG
jgi:hypothetical protein